MKTILYFGCIGDCGHYLWSSERNKIHVRTPFNNDRFVMHLDSAFSPPDTWTQGQAMRSQVGPWTILDWWDRSVDTRPGSHSLVVARGYRGSTLAEILVDFGKVFPSVLARQRFPVVEIAIE